MLNILQGLLTRTIFWLLACWFANISSWNVEMFPVSFFPFNSGDRWAFIISQIWHSTTGAPDWSTSVRLPLPPPSNMWPVRRLQTLLLAAMKAGRWRRFSGLGSNATPVWTQTDGRQKDLKWIPVFLFYFMYHSFVCFCPFVLTDWCGSTTDQNAWWWEP